MIFLTFMCLDLVLERQQSFLFDIQGKESPREGHFQAQLVLLKGQSPGQAKLCWSLKALLTLCFVANQSKSIHETCIHQTIQRKQQSAGKHAHILEQSVQPRHAIGRFYK